MIPHILYNDPAEVITEIHSLALSNIDKEKNLKDFILKLQNINKYSFSNLNGELFLRYVLVCLSYSRLDIEIVNNPTFREKLNSNILEIMSSLMIQDHQLVAFSETLNNEIRSLLEQ